MQRKLRFTGFALQASLRACSSSHLAELVDQEDALALRLAIRLQDVCAAGLLPELLHKQRILLRRSTTAHVKLTAAESDCALWLWWLAAAMMVEAQAANMLLISRPEPSNSVDGAVDACVVVCRSQN